MMYKVERRSFLLWTLGWAAWLLVSCGGDGAGQSRYSNSERSKMYNTQVVDMMETSPQGVLALVDSLEGAGVFDDVNSNYYRAQAYYKMGQELTAEIYYKKVLAGEDLWAEAPSAYYFSCDQLSTILTSKGDHEGSLEIATKGYARARHDQTADGRLWSAALLHDIGYCQMVLDRVDEAETSFKQAYGMLKELNDQQKDYYYLYTWARVSYNIVDAYIGSDQFQKAVRWIPLAEEAVDSLVAFQDCPETMIEEFRGGLATHKAIVLLNTGHRAEANEISRQFIHSHYSSTNIGMVDIAEFLNRAERWDELADYVPRLDSLTLSWQIPPSLYYLREYLVLYLKAYLRSGRDAEALRLADRIVQSIDSISDYELQHNAAELAIVYETQEKEAKIAEQQAYMRQQRLIYTAAALVLLTLFLSIFLVHRYRAARRLAEKNRELEQKNAQLVVANARAEESSRMKTDFIQQISHEIRTPLNILSGFAQVLTMPGMELSEEEKTDIAQHMSENTDRITGLVNKMLELADASSMTVIECSDHVPAFQIAVQAADDSNIRRAAHLTFSMEQTDGMDDVMLTTNLRYAVRVLSLLLDNAQKFTHPAETYVAQQGLDTQESVWLRVEQSDHQVHYIVEDTGVGVPPQEAEHIFEKFVQLDEYYDGTGLGLTVARSIARRLGGDIVLDTSYTAGARFVFSLPAGG